MSERRPFTITKVEEHPDGYWIANITINGVTYGANRRWGSWEILVRQRPRSHEWVRKHLMPEIAAAVQAKVRSAERARAIAKQDLAEAHVRSMMDASRPS